MNMARMLLIAARTISLGRRPRSTAIRLALMNPTMAPIISGRLPLPA